MKRGILSLIVTLSCLCITSTCPAAFTGVTGSDQPHSNIQPSMAMNYMICTVDPGGSSPASGSPYAGEINIYAGYNGRTPLGWEYCQGQRLRISQYESLFSILGTTYGGDGRQDFALPDLRGRVPIGVGTGGGLSQVRLGEHGGVEAVTLTTDQIPSHTHALPSSSNTNPAGGGQAHTNMQPYLGINHVIQTTTAYPPHSSSSDPVTADMRGVIDLFAGSFAPDGTEIAAGQEVRITQNEELFSVLGTTYGGDGRQDFGLPDMQGRTGIHAFQDSDPTAPRLGTKLGEESVTLTEAQMSTHNHDFPPSSDTTGDTGGADPHNNQQPSLALNYIIALGGDDPFVDDQIVGGATPFVGQVELFAGHYAPRGWAFCDGQILPVSQYDALFSIVGTIYGGDGRTTFALPDLRGRSVVGAGQGPDLRDWRVGETFGDELITLSLDQLPGHSHDYDTEQIPEPASTTLCLIGLAGLIARRRKIA